MGISEIINTLIVLSLTPLTDTIVLRVISAGIYLVTGVILITILNKFIKSFLMDKEVVSVFSKLGINKHLLGFLTLAIRYYLYFILVLIILGRLGVSSVLMDVLVFVLIISVVLAVILALKNIIPNAAAGLYISTTDFIKIGDKIEIDNIKGKISEIDLIHTVILTGKSEKTIIPNTLILRHKITKR